MTSSQLLQDCEELHADLALQKARFPSPSSTPWGPQHSEGKHVLLSLPHNRFRSSAQNPWGLQESAFPVMGISLPEQAFEGDVTYTPVEAFQPLPTVSTHPACCLPACLPACLQLQLLFLAETCIRCVLHRMPFLRYYATHTRKLWSSASCQCMDSQKTSSASHVHMSQ